MRKPSISSAKAPAVKRSGTQSIERSILVLREMATRSTTGWGLWDLADRCGLDRGTTHRILSCLARERMVFQRESDRHYFLGPLIFELGVTLLPYGEFQRAGHSILLKLSRNFKNSVALLYLRTGNECVCIAREGKSSYTRDNTGIRVGYIAPMLSLAGGVAMLSFLPKQDAARVLSLNSARLQHLGQTRLRRARKLVAVSSRQGYVFSEGVVWQGVNSFSVPVTNSLGQVVGSIALSGTSDDFPQTRAEEVVPVLRAMALELAPEADALLRMPR